MRREAVSAHVLIALIKRFHVVDANNTLGFKHLLYNKLRSKLSRLTVDFQKPVVSSIFRELAAVLMRSSVFRRSVKPLIRQSKPERLVFVCGCYNSGTTILREIIGSHRQVASMPREGVVYTSRLTSHSSGDWTRFWPSTESIFLSNKQDFQALTADELLIDWNPWIRERRLFLEKSITNATRMVELQSLFPDAHFVVISRDQTSVAEGIVRRTRRVAGSDASSERPDMERAMGQWVQCKELIEQQMPLLTHKHAVRYEDLIKDPLHEIDQIFRFLGLEASVEKWKEGISVDGLKWVIFDGNAKSSANLLHASNAVDCSPDGEAHGSGRTASAESTANSSK